VLFNQISILKSSAYSIESFTAINKDAACYVDSEYLLFSSAMFHKKEG